MKPEDYIGKKLNECPDGTKAIVSDPNGFECVREYRDGRAYDCRPFPLCHGDGSGYTVTHTLTLGKPRPKTLADEEPGVAWKGEGGLAFWRDRSNGVYAKYPDGSYPLALSASYNGIAIGPDWTRLGKITGIEIDGKVYRGEGGGE